MINLTKDPEFMAANKVLKGEQIIHRTEGEDKSQSKKWVSKPDFSKMYKFVCNHLDDPETLQQKVFLDLNFYGGHRGREGLWKLTKSSFEIKENPDGKKFIVMTHNEQKKKQGDENSGARNQISENRPLIMEHKNSDLCPVKSFQAYLTHLHPNAEFLFQKPKYRINTKYENIWHEKNPVGEGKLGEFFKTISTRVKMLKNLH